MKKIRTRLLSLLLVLVTVLSLLPTSALAASSTGTGIKPTNNTNYWTTRLLHDGTPPRSTARLRRIWSFCVNSALSARSSAAGA